MWTYVSRRCLLVLKVLGLLAFACLLYLIPSAPPMRYRLLVGWNESNDSSSHHSLIFASPPQPQVSANESGADDECVKRFLADYRRYCETRLTKSVGFPQGNASHHLCPCIPGSLVGFVGIDQSDNTTLDDLESSLSFLRERGRWRPPECVARQRLAIIIPYADRERHLRIFLNHMHPILQRQLLDYSIFIIEQLTPELFNRAALMNVGFVEANSTDSFDCFVFHDIDQLPIDDRNFYTCSEVPRHVVGYRKKFNYNYAYSTSFGGGNSFTRQEFESINGYSNSFYGWGGEDDDLYQRTEAKKMRRTRYPRCIAKYDEIIHERDKRNPMGADQQLGFRYRPDVYKVDGLSNLNYSAVSRETRKLFTKISVSLPDPPSSRSRSHKSGLLVLLVALFGYCLIANRNSRSRPTEVRTFRCHHLLAKTKAFVMTTR